MENDKISNSLSTIKESFEDKIDIIKNDFDCLINLANKMVNKVKDEETNNDNMIKQFKKYETIESDIVKLNVGGTMFSTLKTTLTKKIKDKEEKLYLPNMFESLVDGFVKPKYDENKAIFIDRNPRYFGCILDYLRMANTDFEYELASSIDKNELLKEAIFYNIQGLVDLIENRLNIDSIILNTADAKNNLFKICEFSSTTNFKILYRATRDGFSAQNFHSKCDHAKNTLTIIKTTGNYIFGGYTEQSWDGSNLPSWDGYGAYKSDPNAFIFSINNNIKAKINPGYQANAIYCSSNYGPTFGSGHDIYISNNSNLSNQQQEKKIGSFYRTHKGKILNSSNQSYSFIRSFDLYLNDYDYENSLLAESQNFTVSEIEVYCLN